MEPMKPMDPMTPMAPMKPMAPIEPMPAPTNWWPEALGVPASSGSQNDVHYAVFPKAHRVLLRRDGGVEQYDTGEHRIQGVTQVSDQAGGHASFRSDHGAVELSKLRRIDEA
ncbi:MAG: hypothetical protein ABW067_13565 [Rhizobacter sp.]